MRDRFPRLLGPVMILGIAPLVCAQAALRTLTGHNGGVSSVAFSPDGKWLATCAVGDSARLWDARTGAARLVLKEQAMCAAFFPDGKSLALNARDSNSNAGLVKVLDAQTGEATLQFVAHAMSVHALALSPDGKTIATTTHDRTVKVWEASGEPRFTLVGGRGTKVVFAPDSKTLATDTRDGVRLWNAESGQPIRDFEHTAANAVVFSPDGKLLATGSGGVIAGLPQGEIRLWDVQTGDLKRTVKAITSSIAFSPDGKFLFTGGSADAFGDVKIWDAQTGDLRNTLFGHGSWVVALAISSDGKWLASGSLDKTVKVWDVSGLK